MAASRNRPSSDLLKRVADFVVARLSATEPVTVGLSGGCDSVVLLHLLSRLCLGRRLQAIHVHHGLSPNADEWAGFCRQYCARLELDCFVVHVKVDHKSGTGLEAAARAARYGAFAQSGMPSIFLAHHAGDQAETVLFNLLRGTGVSGMAGMRAERVIDGVRYLRPLLPFSRHEIETYAEQEGLFWITDESNEDRHFSRNFIRHEVLTAINQKFPAAEALLSQAAAHFFEADTLLGELALLDWQLVAEGESAKMRPLRQLSFPRLKNLLRFRLHLLGWKAPEASRLEEFARQLLTAGLDRHPQLDLPDGRMKVMQGALHWIALK